MGIEILRRILRPKDSIRQSDAASILLEAEIEECLSYFERTESETRDSVIKEAREKGILPAVIPEFLMEPVRFKSIHGRNYTVGRLAKGGHFWETGDNVQHRIGNGAIPGDIIQAIQNITVPYAQYVKSKGK